MSAAPRIGGQAVIEGVMMRHKNTMAIAVRTPDDEISLYKETLFPAAEKFPVLKLPVLRGVVAFIESLVLGVRALTISANKALPEEEEEDLTAFQLTLTVFLAILLAVVLFFLLPTLLVRYLASLLPQHPVLLNLTEGVIRLVIFFSYLLLVSRMKDVRRVFEYHGAEHKTISCFEAGEPLVLANVRKYSTLHPRCGTSFLLLVMAVSILLFSFFGWPSLPRRLLLRLLLLPVVAGVSYELIQLAGRFSFFRYLTAPGIWLQRLTTREPDDDQLAVAIKAVETVLAGNKEVLKNV